MLSNFLVPLESLLVVCILNEGGFTVFFTENCLGEKQGIKNHCLGLVLLGLNACAGSGIHRVSPEPRGALGDAQGCCQGCTLR